MNDVEIMLHMLLSEEAEKHGLVIESVRASTLYSCLQLTLKFEGGYEGKIGTKNKTDGAELLSAFLELARSTRGRFQLWSGIKRTKEYAAGLERMSDQYGKQATRISELSNDFDPEDCVTRKKGRTPGGRTYEVVDGPFGRKIVVIDEAMGTAAQRGPFVKSATRIYKLNSPTAMNGNTSREKGWRRRARLFVEPRVECRFLRTFVDLTASKTHHRRSPNFFPGFIGIIPDRLRCEWPITCDLVGTHDPAAVPLRVRRLARLVCQIASGKEFPPPKDWKKKDKLAFPQEWRIHWRAWALSYYEDSVVKAHEMFDKTLQIFQNDHEQWRQLETRFKEII